MGERQPRGPKPRRLVVGGTPCDDRPAGSHFRSESTTTTGVADRATNSHVGHVKVRVQGYACDPPTRRKVVDSHLFSTNLKYLHRFFLSTLVD
jgi:hypothetical protein